MPKYKKQKELFDTEENSEAVQLEQIETKICSVCGRELPIEKFNFWNKSKGTYMTMCKDCEHEKHSKKYEGRKELINKLKSCGCCCCDETDVNCLDFHHVDPNEKEFNMSAALNKPLKKVLEEASKCVVVCSNCHRKIHAGTIDLNKYINIRQHTYTQNLMNIALGLSENEK